jgi:hypothetical protein
MHALYTMDRPGHLYTTLICVYVCPVSMPISCNPAFEPCFTVY